MEQKHDRGYKALFSHPQLVRELLTSFVDEPWVAEVDFEKASVDKTFVTRRMAKLESDMIWRLPLRNQ
jgi:hypothetical protein